MVVVLKGLYPSQLEFPDRHHKNKMGMSEEPASTEGGDKINRKEIRAAKRSNQKCELIEKL